MTNHPNRSASSPLHFVAYSTASMDALGEGKSIAEALTRAAFHACGQNEFMVVAQIRSQDPLDRVDILPPQAVIVWRGENELAQRFRRGRSA